jgi:glycerol kinase
LDYTNNFSGNKSPDSFLYNFLADLYGSVDGSRKPNITSTDGGNDSTASQSTGGRRKTRYYRPSTNSVAETNQRRLFSSVTDETRRRELLKRWDEINASVLKGINATYREEWRVLHRTELGEAHEIELDEEHKVQVYFLLA